MCLSLLQVFPSCREYPKGLSGTWPRGSTIANSAHGPYIKCGLGPVGLIQILVSCGQRPYYREFDIVRSRTCAKASRLGKRSFVSQRQSSIKRATTALHFLISCARRASRKAGFTGTL